VDGCGDGLHFIIFTTYVSTGHDNVAVELAKHLT
jgi:hypothetical protein